MHGVSYFFCSSALCSNPLSNFNLFFWGIGKDVEIYHLETAQHLEFTNVSVVTQGPLRAAVRAEVKYGQSNISITVTSC
jgi:hypothetical protein